ncbi:SOS-response repressor and protease LexA [Franconibacter pulveris]
MKNKSQRLTVRQQEVLALLKGFIKEHGYPPTQKEVASLMGATSPNAAGDMLRSLQQRGAITLVKGVSRGITINSQAEKRLVKVNLNTIARLKLNDAAIAEFNHQYEQLRTQHPFTARQIKTPEPDSDGFYSMELWSVMNLFGHLCFNGADIPFELNLELEGE